MQQDKTDTAHYRPTDGDIVEVVLRGKVSGAGLTRFHLGDASSNRIVPSQTHVVSVTKVEVLKPWDDPKSGDIYIAPAGSAYLRGRHDWVTTNDGRFSDVRMQDAFTATFREGRITGAQYIRDGQVVSS